ncbi:MAG TPA: GDYXXLXY domain-containing protein [Bacillota bacterium]|nr:GDYXXLXY domain-containing protein [Bacillota bacterium]
MKKFLLFVFLQVFVLVYMVASQYAVEAYGKEVRLQTAPVDPKDVLYGDYVMLNYEISNIAVDKFDQIPNPGDTVYIVLKKEGSYHQIISAHLQKPSITTDQAVLNGRVEYVRKQWEPIRRDASNVMSAHIVYGFERYYVPEGAGKDLERKRGQFDVLIKTSPWGQHLSSLSFIANDVLTLREVEEQIYQYFEKQSIPIEMISSHLIPIYESHSGPVWSLEVRKVSKKSMETPMSRTLILVDAKTGKILSEKKIEDQGQ